MIYDPYKTQQAGVITAALLIAEDALRAAYGPAIYLAGEDDDWSKNIIGAIDQAQKAVARARKLDLWELSRP